MKELLCFGILVTLIEKRSLERLAEANGESLASLLRRLIRQVASAHGLGIPEPSLSNSHAGESHE